MIAGYFIVALGYVGYIFVSTQLGLFLIQIILGLGTAINKPAYVACYSKHLEKKKFVSQWGLWEAKEYIIGAIAALLGGFLVSRFSFELLFVLMAVLSFLSGVVIFIQPRKLI